MEQQNEKSIALTITPPVYYLGGLVLGLVLHLWVAPIDILPESKIDEQLGLLIIIIGVMLFLWSGQTMAKFGVNPRFQPVKNLISTGPFGWSRNPIYVSFTLMYLGITIMYNTLWPVLFLPVVLSLIHYRIILREEDYLESVFGQDYHDYRKKVRRWM